MDGTGNVFTGTYGATGSFQVSGSVNGNVPGVYVLEYRKVDANGNVTTEIRTVTVVDTTPPSAPICTANPTVTSGATTITCTNVASGDTATIPGLSCVPTPSTGGNVVCVGTILTTNPTVTVTDPSSNVSTGTVIVTLDTTAPVVTLNGSGTVTVAQ